MEIQGEFVPSKLVDIKPPVKGLWWRGDRKLCDHPKIVAIVGSRRMSQYGKRVLAEIVPKLVELGYVTISGFMYGIDIEMHRLTIENGGKTIGVFGWGIEAPIIPENQNLYHKALESECLFISELEPKQLGTLWSFPRRNRIVVGMAELVIVVEAGIKSGSLNSAAWARKFGKPVLAVPGPIFSNVSEGCNWLISQGLAKPFTLDYFKGESLKERNFYSEKGRINRGKFKITKDESNLITLLTLGGPQSINELARQSGRSVGEVSADLTRLLLSGVVEEERGVWVVIN